MLASAALSMGLPAANADEFSVTPKYAQSIELDSNPLLAPSGGKTLYGTVSMPEVTLYRSTANSWLSLDNLFNISRYNLDQFSSTDVHSTLAGKQSWEISYFSMSGKLDYDTTRSSEFNNSGINVAGVRHTGVSLAPEFGISLNARDSFVVDGTASSASYGNTRLYQNYVTYGITPSLQRALDSKDIVSVLLQTSHYNTASGVRNSANTIGPALGWQRQLTRAISFNISGGYQLVKLDIFGQGTSTQYQSFYSADLKYTRQDDTFHLTSSRQEQPQSSGQLITATTIGFTGSHLFTRSISDAVNINYQMDAYTTPLSGNETSFLEANENLSYRLAKRWVLVSTLRYRREGRVGNFLPADSEAMLMTLVFSPPEIDFQE